jgi:hypothetical protein
MALSAAGARRTHAPGPLLVALGLGLVLFVIGARAAGLGETAWAQTFVLIFTSIVVEALPFILLGALVSAVIEVYVPDRWFTTIARLPAPLQMPAAALGGVLMPVCECGSVPVARRLVTRGLHPGAGVAFMLASPILNPVVLASTLLAYSGRGAGLQMVLGRAGLGLVLALVGGWALGGHSGAELLRRRPEEDAVVGHAAPTARRTALVEHLAGDFFFMGRFIVIGAALAAALQTVIPQSLVSGVATTPVVGSLALMGLAFVLSLCSEADAFVAVSFVGFPLGAQLAFLVFGPVVDAKLTLLYGATFRRRFAARLAVVAVPVVLAGSLWFEVVVR